MKITLWKIFWIFFKIGLVLLGGGFVILPMLYSEFTEKRNWLTKEELTEYFSLSQCLPGIIAINISIFTGYKLRSLPGAIASITGVCLSPIITIICIASILNIVTNSILIKNIFWGVGIGIILLVVLTLKEILPTSITDRFTLILFLLITILATFSGISPAILIIISVLLGLIYKLTERRFVKK